MHSCCFGWDVFPLADEVWIIPASGVRTLRTQYIDQPPTPPPRVVDC